jgi:hypothetical protein
MGVGGGLSLRDRRENPGSTKPTSRLPRVPCVGGATPERRTPSLKKAMGVRGGSTGIGFDEGGGGGTLAGERRGTGERPVVTGLRGAARDPKATFGRPRPVPTISNGEAVGSTVSIDMAPGTCTAIVGTLLGRVRPLCLDEGSRNATIHRNLHCGAILRPSTARKQSPPQARDASFTQSKVSVAHLPRHWSSKSVDKGIWAWRVEDETDPKEELSSSRLLLPERSTMLNSNANGDRPTGSFTCKTTKGKCSPRPPFIDVADAASPKASRVAAPPSTHHTYPRVSAS